jgi:hypothetical protein
LSLSCHLYECVVRLYSWCSPSGLSISTHRGKRHVHRVPATDGVPQLPRPRQKELVPEPLTGPRRKVLDGLVGGGLVEPGRRLSFPIW